MFTLRRLAQEDERQERHERLVEVEQVELLALEHRADLANVARREGERPDRAVDRHREAHADPDDVALGRPLEAVAGGDDPDVVAAQAEVLVEVADVLGDAARQRVDVRADEADLHRRPAPAPVRRARAPRRSAAAGTGRPGSRGRAPCRRAGPGPPTSSRASRPYLRSCRPNVAELRRGPVERAVVMRPCARGSPRRRSSAVRPGNVVQPVPIASSGVGVAVADLGEAVLVGEADDAAVPRPAERRRVERLDRVGADRADRGRRGAGAGPSPGRTAGTGRAGGPGSRGRPARGSSAIVVAQRAVAAGSRSLDEQREQVAAERRDLLADDDLGPQPAVAGDRPAGDGGVDPLVVGDRDDVEVGLALDVVEDLLDAGRPVGGERVDVEVGPARAASVMPRPRRRRGRLEVRPDREEDRPPLLRARRR